MILDNMFHNVSRCTNLRDDLKSKKIAKTVAAIAVLASSSAFLASCGEPSAVPMNDEFAGNSGQSENDSGNASKSYDSGAQQSHASAQSEDSQNQQNSPKTDTGNYKDGDYKIKAKYGPVAEDSIDVNLSVANGNISSVQITSHPFTPISKKHMSAFSEAIPGKIVGKPLKDLHISVVAGASWTSVAFNKALDVARQEASIQSAK
ncbi:FMN-binding protein [Gardnerella vaginalis]|uniref:FMN-binding protein n=1 Tax=Gardnerella vaginalis TaxID=2702 RepID=UPI00200F6E91|nr:FMN-binding protein [Gardnerella vaginalis]UQA83028.1 FMN-binding protein [Gardnerella vaginalis]UQA87763.1 FMN-binding protein [Gardnerella vaginalis]